MDYNKLTPIVEKAQGGDKAAMDELLESVRKDIYFHATKATRDSHLAEDVTQEVLIEIFLKLKTLRVPKLFPVWAKRILHNKCASYFRGEQDLLLDANEDDETLLDVLPDTDDTHIPEKVLEDKELGDTLMSLIDTLPGEQRMATVLYFYEHMSTREIATIQGKSEETVKSRLKYSRKALKTKIEEYEQKTGTKLHGVAILPLLMHSLFRDQFASTMLPSALETFSAATVASTATAATGATVTAATTATTATTAATATAAGIGAGIGTKIIAGIVAAGVIIGGAVGTTALIRNRNEKEEDKTEESSKKADEPYTVVNDTTQVEGVWRFMEGQWISSDLEADFDASQAYDFTFNLDGSVTVQDTSYPCIGEPVYYSSYGYGVGFSYSNTNDGGEGPIDICGLKVSQIFFVVGDDGKYIAELEIPIEESRVAKLKYYRVSDYNDDGSIKITDENGNHLHTFSAAYKFDDHSHWHECSCGERSYEGEHNGENGKSEYDICVLCGYKNEEKLAQTYSALTPSEGLDIHVGENSCRVDGFGSCTDKVIVIPETYEGKPVTSIARGAFAKYNRSSDSPYSEFEEIHFPPTIDFIGDRAFWGADSLKKIHIYSNTKITANEYAFWECKSLESIDTSVFSMGDKYLFSDCASFLEFAIPEGTEYVGKGLLNECLKLEKLYIPKSLKKIPSSMCYTCTELRDIYYDGTIEEWSKIVQNVSAGFAAIEKNYLWWEASGDFTVHCIDGDLQKADAVVSGEGYSLEEWNSFE